MIKTDKKVDILIVLFLLMISSLSAYSQNICLESMRNLDFYVGVDNPLTLHVSDVPCDSILISTTNGKIRKKQDCRYLYVPQSRGATTLTIYQITDKDTVEIGAKRGNARGLPKPTARVGGKINGDIERSHLLAQIGVSIALENFGFDLGIRAIEFRTIVLRNEEVVFNLSNQGYKFNQDTKNGLSLIKSGDVVYFVSIIGLYPSGFETTTNSIELKIK